MTRKGPRSVLIIEARFYEDIADELARGAIDELEANSTAYERLAVPGSLDLCFIADCPLDDVVAKLQAAKVKISRAR